MGFDIHLTLTRILKVNVNVLHFTIFLAGLANLLFHYSGSPHTYRHANPSFSIPPQQSSKIINPSLCLSASQPIPPSSTAKNLDFTSVFTLSFSKQISSIFRSCHHLIRDLCHIRHTIDFTTASTIATSLVHWRLDYCNSLSFTSSHSNQMSTINLNALARTIACTPSHAHINPALNSLHWLKVEQHMQFKIISLIKSPAYIWYLYA